MRITLLGSSLSGDGQEQFLTSIRVDETIAIDAGVLGISGVPHDQARIQHLLLSHSHADHLATLPLFIENTCFAPGGRAAPLTIYGHAAVLDCLRRDLFNDRVWPDYFRLAREKQIDAAACPRLVEIQEGVPLLLDGVKVTPVAVHHTVPTFGFLVEGRNAAAAIATDTGPTDRLWELANRCEALRAVFLDASFPNALDRLARVSGHLTPALFAAEAAKIRRGCRLVAVHIKAAYRQRITEELGALGMPGVEIGAPGTPYEL